MANINTGGGASIGRDANSKRDVVGRDWQNTGNYFDFGPLRDKLESGEAEDGMLEISRLIREFYRSIALLEYRIKEVEQKFTVMVWMFAIMLVVLVFIAGKLFL